MARNPENEPVVINSVNGEGYFDKNIFSTHSPDKRREVVRILGENNVIFTADDLNVDEVQSTDPLEVAKKKAISAWKENGYSPVIVEDVSVQIPALEHLLPSPYVNTWGNSPESRKIICEMLGADRRAIARATYAVFDGKEVHLRIGKVEGTISAELRGSNGFKWDDFFIPNGSEKTFAEMDDSEKDAFSMRRMGLEKILHEPFPLGHYVFQMLEPDSEEISRIRINELLSGDSTDKAALQFAYSLESLVGNEQNNELKAEKYWPIQRIEQRDENGVSYYVRYTINPESPSLGLLLTNISRSRVMLSPNGEPFLFQMGPERRKLALAQRVEFFKHNQNEKIHNAIDRLEQGIDTISLRPNRRHQSIEDAIGVKQSLARKLIFGMGRFAPKSLKDKLLSQWQATKTISWDEVAYRKKSADQLTSRRPDVSDYLLNKIGKYYRRPIGGGSMPVTTGSKDELVMSALGHMVSFIPRNSRYAGDIDLQIKLAQEAQQTIKDIEIPTVWKERAFRNIGASLGVENPQQTLEEARRLYHEGGIKLFRIYTIGTDPRMVETARLLREEFGDDIEIFAGQISDKALAKKLMSEDIRVDALIYGHGGGRQCTSGENHMAITTVEEAYEVVTDADYNNTTILIEGGIGTNISSALILGIDGVLYNNRIVHGTIESPAGDIYVRELKKEKYVQPYPGSASSETAIIESVDEEIRKKRTNLAGRIYTEGKPGFMYDERKAGGSMAFWINELLSDASKMLADIGVRNISELRKYMANDQNEVIRIITDGAQQVSTAYGNTA